MEEKDITRIVIIDPHGNRTADKPISTEGATEQVTQHNVDPDAHQIIQSAVEGLRDKTRERLTDLVVVGRDGTETSMSQYDQEGNKVAKLPADQIGKIDGVLVNGEELPVDENGKVNVPVPTSVEEIDQDGEYAKKTYVDGRTIGTVTATVMVGEEQKAATVTKDGENVHIDFPDMQGEKGDPLTWDDLTEEQKDRLTGPQGKPGTGAIWNEDAEVLTELEHEVGNATNRTMSQDAVTKELIFTTKVIASTSSVSKYIGGTNSQWIKGNGNNNCEFFPVTPGKKYRITPQSGKNSHVIMLTSTSTSNPVAYAGGVTTMPSWNAVDAVVIVTAPNDAAYLYARKMQSEGNNVLPTVEELVFSKERLAAIDENVESLNGNIKADDLCADIQTIDTSLYTQHEQYISNNAWATGNSSNTCIVIDVKPGYIYKFECETSYHVIFLKNTFSGTPRYAGGITSMPSWISGANQMVAPFDAQKLYVRALSGGENHLPTIKEVNPPTVYTDEVLKEEETSYWIGIDTTPYPKVNGVAISEGVWASFSSSNYCKFIPVVAGRKYKIANRPDYSSHCAVFLRDDSHVVGDEPHYAEGCSVGNFYPYDEYVVAPSNARFLYVRGSIGSTVVTPFIYQQVSVKDELRSITSERTLLQQSLYTGSTSPTAQPLALLHYSDIHGDTTAANEVLGYLARFKDFINDLLVTGDVVEYYAEGTTTYPKDYLWWQGCGLAEKSLLVLGNHDGATTDTTEYDDKDGSAAWDGKGQQWDYDTYIAPYAEDLGIVLPTGYDDSKSPYYKACYWHKDYAAQKIRLIGLDVMHRFDGVLVKNGSTWEIGTAGVKHLTDEQEQWFIERLSETLTGSGDDAEGYSVIVCAHYPLDDFAENGIAGPVISHKTNDVVNFHYYPGRSMAGVRRYNMRDREGIPSDWDKGEVNNIGNILQDFIDNDGKVVAWLCGHYHADYMFYSDYYPDILNIAIAQTGWLRGGAVAYKGESSPMRAEANFITFDTVNSLIRIVRFGLKTDKYLTPKNAICYDYANKKVINEW